MTNQLKAISLFSGAGGDTLGMKMANINVIGYVEYDKDAIKTHEHNFPNCVKIGEDITQIDDKIFKKYENKIDILFGGFPCQSYSHGGKKNPLDKRGFLYQEFVRATNIIKPSIIIGENVKGILSRKMVDNTLFIDEIINEFTKIGYDMKYTLFDTSNFEVPQSRKRVLIYGIKKSLNIKLDLENTKNKHPKYYNKDIVKFSLQNALKIDDKIIIEEIKKGKCLTDIKNKDVAEGKPPSNLLKCYKQGKISFKTRSSPNHSCIIDLNDFSRTILCSYGRMPRLFVSVLNSHGYWLRPYTIRELQLIQGFPEDFKFCGNYINQVKQIGNAVPPIFIKHIMNYIKNILKKNIIEL